MANNEGFKIAYIPGPGMPVDKPLQVPSLGLSFKPGLSEARPCDLTLAVQLCGTARDLHLVHPDGTVVRRPDLDHKFLKKHKLPVSSDGIEVATYYDPKTGKYSDKPFEVVEKPVSPEPIQIRVKEAK